MNSTPSDIFTLAEKRLAWIGQRQGILAQNIANANTPGYNTRDVTPFSEVLATEKRRAGQGSGLGPISGRATGERTLNGNSVVMDDQLEKVSETDTAQQLATNLYKKYVSLFKTALGRS